jgi:Domain of unknown function (DUF5606)
MEYKKIIAVTGLPGLYELLSSKTDGAIVRSLDDKTTRFVSSRIHNFSHLESIEVYTVRDNVNLADVLKAMEASAENLPDDKDNSSLKDYFSKVYPDLDFDRVYTSDLKKMVKWFTVLRSNDIEITFPEKGEEGEEGGAPKAEDGDVKDEAPKQTTGKVVEEKGAKTAKAEEKEVKPVKAEKSSKGEKAKAETVAEKPKAKKAAEKKTEEKKVDEKKTSEKKKADTTKKEPATKKSPPAGKKKTK